MKPVRHYVVPSLCAGLMAASSVLYADQYGGKSSTGSQAKDPMQSSQYQGQPDLASSYQSKKLIGMTVENRQGEGLGEISQLIIDQDGNVTHVVLSAGGVLGVGGEEYLVSWDRLDLSKDRKHALIDVDKDNVSSEFSAFEIQEEERTPMQETPEESPAQGGGM